MYSNDELIYNDKRTERGNRDDDEEENIDTRELEEAERYNHSVENRLNDKRDEDWRAHYQHKNKEPSRDQQIRVSKLSIFILQCGVIILYFIESTFLIAY